MQLLKYALGVLGGTAASLAVIGVAWTLFKKLAGAIVRNQR